MAHKFSNAIRPIRHQGAGNPLGLNIAGTTTPCGYVQVTGKAGEVQYIRASEFLHSKFDQGAWCQVVGGPVTLEYTLQNEALASNPEPDAQKLVSWVNKETISPGAIHSLNPVACTCLKVTFTNNGAFFVLAR